jgi:hypothetical protein
MLNLVIIYTLLKRSRFSWFILLTILIVTTPIVVNYHSNAPFEYVSFTMSPVFQIKDFILQSEFYRYSGLMLQLLLMYWLFRKDTRTVYKIS